MFHQSRTASGDVNSTSYGRTRCFGMVVSVVDTAVKQERSVFATIVDITNEVIIFISKVFTQLTATK